MGGVYCHCRSRQTRAAPRCYQQQFVDHTLRAARHLRHLDLCRASTQIYTSAAQDQGLEQLCLGDAAAALDPQIGFTFQGVALDNEATLHSAHLAHGDHIYIGERRSPPVSRRVSRTPSPTGDEVNYQSIAGIWAGTNADSAYDSGSNSAYDSGSNSGDEEA